MLERKLLSEKNHKRKIKDIEEEILNTKDNLNKKQIKFADLYIEYFNGARAAREAGYSPRNPKNARIQASLLLKNQDIIKYIELNIEKEELKKDISREETREILADIIRNSEKEENILKAIKILLDDDNKNNEISLKMEQLKSQQNLSSDYSSVIFVGEDEIEA